MDVCTQQREEMKISSNFVYTKHLSKRELWTETIEVWDYLVEAGYNPADFSCGLVNVYIEGFAKLVARSGGFASVKETNVYRSNSVWIGNVEINFVEFKSEQSGGWTLVESWRPL